MKQNKISRRVFVKGMGTGTAMVSTMTSGLMQSNLTSAQEQQGTEVVGPGMTSISLLINGVSHEISIEPRETLLEVLRNRLDITGPKQVCDRGTCGACTVQIDGQTIYACMKLAIEAQGSEIITIEGLANGDQLHPAQEAIVEADGIQCGFCSPGFAISMATVLNKNPNASHQEIQHHLCGHICRCGTYAQMNHAIDLVREKMGGTP